MFCIDFVRVTNCFYDYDYDSLMNGNMCCKLHSGQTQLLFSVQQSSIDSLIFVENRDFCLPHLHLMPTLGGGARPNIATTLGKKRPEWFGYPTLINLCRYDYSF